MAQDRHGRRAGHLRPDSLPGEPRLGAEIDLRAEEPVVESLAETRLERGAAFAFRRDGRPREDIDRLDEFVVVRAVVKNHEIFVLVDGVKRVDDDLHVRRRHSGQPGADIFRHEKVQRDRLNRVRAERGNREGLREDAARRIPDPDGFVARGRLDIGHRSHILGAVRDGFDVDRRGEVVAPNAVAGFVIL